MPSKKQRLNTAKTYIILDTQVLPFDDLVICLKRLVAAGVGIVQLRDKHTCAKDVFLRAKVMKRICGDKTLFIVNDRVDVALGVGADGVHVGQDDLPMLAVRALVKEKMLVGVSCQNLAHARRAVAQGADYIGFGSIFKTLTKPERSPIDLKLLQNVHKQIKIPIFPIGGIDRNNITMLLNCGIKRAAICRDVLLNKDPGNALKEFESIFKA